VLLDLGAAPSTGMALQAIAAQLRRVPNRGLGYGALRYLTGDKRVDAQVRALPQAEVVFNYRGQLRPGPDLGLFRPAPENDGRMVSPLGNRGYLLDFRADIVEGRFRLDLSYSANLHRSSTAERLVDGFMAALRSLRDAAPDVAER